MKAFFNKVGELFSKFCESLKKVDILLVGVFAYLARMFFIHPTFPEAVVFIAVCSIYGFHKFLTHNKEQKIDKDIQRELQEQIKSVKNALGVQRMHNESKQSFQERSGGGKRGPTTSTGEKRHF